MQPFCIVIGSDIILLNTGLGFEQDGEPQLYRNLKEHGISHLNVTKVLLSHLHKDHAGGCGRKQDDGSFKAAFPNAKYYIGRKEFESALEVGLPSYFPDEIMFLKDDEKVVWLDDSGQIDGYIEHWTSGGHSPFHQVFNIMTSQGTFFFGGDDAPQLNQMKSKYVAKYDFDGKKAMSNRQSWWELGKKEGWNFLFYHDITTPLFKHDLT